MQNNTNEGYVHTMQDNQEVEQAVEETGFKLIKASSVTKDIFPDEWLVDEFLLEDGLIEIFGAPASFKSFVIMDICFAIATGRQWHGRDVKQGSVTYIVGEGAKGVRKRIRALELEYGVEGDYPLYLSETPMDLTNPQSCEAVATAIEKSMDKTSLLVIDTLHRNSTGSEDSSEDFSKILQNLDKYFRGKAGVVGWVHHTGHGAGDRSRGTSSRFGALDASYLVERGEEDKNRVTITNNKQKDAEESPPICLNAKVKDLGVVDNKLRSITSLVLREANTGGYSGTISA